MRGKPLVFLDSAASAQKPRVVIDAMRDAMETQYANVHRGLHWMSERTTDAYEAARDAVAALINARDRNEIVITRNVTESLNLMAHSYGRGVLRPGQAVLISGDGAPFQHRALAVAARRPRHRAARRADHRRRRTRHGGVRGAAGRRQGRPGVDHPHVQRARHRTRRRERIVRIAHAHGAKVLFDGAQAMVHRRVDVQALDCDFYAFTGHKLYGPTGIGVLWGRRELLERDAAVPRRRRNDFVGDLRAIHLGARCRTSSRPARRRSWKASA